MEKREMIFKAEVEILKAKAEGKEVARISFGCSTLARDVQDIVELYDNSNEFTFVGYRINQYGNKIMFIIPQQVQIVSIENTEDNHIVIEAVSEKYEQLGFFLTAIEEDKMFENLKSSAGDKSDSLVKIIIEGDLK